MKYFVEHAQCEIGRKRYQDTVASRMWGEIEDRNRLFPTHILANYETGEKTDKLKEL